MASTRDGKCRVAPAVGLLLIGLGVLAAANSRAVAADTEVRDFNVLVDGSRAGDYHVSIQHADDGTLTMTLTSEVRVKVIGVTFYSYTYRGREVWRDGRLQRLESNGQENGKPFTVTAVSVVPAANTLRVTCNGQSHVVSPDVWTMTYWMLPPAERRNKALPLLGGHNGQDVNGTLQYVGTERLTVAGQEQNCTHYRVTGSTPHELWYDGQERIVRQEWAVDGHKTVLELTRVGH
jgi:YD repeat-containing protein